MSSVSYSSRVSIGKDERVYEFTDEALVWQDGDSPKKGLPFSKLISVNCSYEPNRVQANRYVIKLSTAKSSHIIASTSYVSLGNFEDRGESFRSFVMDLHRKIVEVNPAVVFKQGSSQAGYIFSIFVTVGLICLFGGLALVTLLMGLIPIAILKGAILLFMFPRLIRYVKKNKPGNYDPLNIPEDVLP